MGWIRIYWCPDKPVGQRILRRGAHWRRIVHRPIPAILSGGIVSEDSIVAIVTAIIGSGALGSLTGYLAQHLAKRRTMVTRDDIQALTEQLAKGDRHFRILDAKDVNLRDEMQEMKRIMLRQCLFAHPRDRNAEESILQSGEEYIEAGGNGVGHIRLDQVKADYARRLRDDDWDYSHDRP